MTENFDTTFTPDPAFQPPESDNRINAGSALDVLKLAVAAQVEHEDLLRRIPQRPAIMVAYSTVIDGDKFQMWQRRSQRPKSNDVDVLRLSAIVLANQTKHLLVEYKGADTIVRGEDGEPLNFQHPDFRAMILGGDVNKSIGATQLVRDLFANDGHLIAAAREVIDAAGYGDEANEFDEDPTMV